MLANVMAFHESFHYLFSVMDFFFNNDKKKIGVIKMLYLQLLWIFFLSTVIFCGVNS